MKTKILLSILTIGLHLSAFSQKSTIELSFTAENSGQYVTLDSILIENLTQGGDTTLYSPDTILILNYITGIGDIRAIGENSFSVSQNYPNPFKGMTSVNLYLPVKEHIELVVQDIIGRKLAHYKNTLNKGNHSFAFSAGNEKYYLLTVTGKQTRKTIKMINTKSNTTYGGKCKIIYNGFDDKEVILKSQQTNNDFEFNLGDELKYTAFTDVEKEEMGGTPLNSLIYTLVFDGWLPCPGTSTVTDIDGNIYNTALIGSQCWMKENLKTITYRNGTPIPNVTDENTWSNLSSGAYVWYDNNISWKGSYGALYNWFTTVNANGLCPEGWHVPTNDERIVLTDYIGGTGAPHGNELKSCRQMNSPLGDGCNTTEHPKWDEDDTHYGTDDYGFSALPSGFRWGNGVYTGFVGVGNSGYWWSSTETSSDYAWSYILGSHFGFILTGDANKRTGTCVRCIKD